MRLDTTVLALEPGGRLRISTPAGLETIAGRAVLLASGIRETPRAARLVSGTRPWGVTTTGAFQEIVQATGRAPFRRPLIVGSEFVSFSNLLAARHAGVRPVALIEVAAAPLVPWPVPLLARLLGGARLLTRTTLAEIRGAERVEAVVLRGPEGERVLACDGVIFSGAFVPEAVLARAGALRIDPGTAGPTIDQFWRCSDPACFAAGNVLRAVKSAGRSAAEGRAAAAAMIRALRGDLPPPEPAVPLRAEGRLRYAMPQRLIAEDAMVTVHARAALPGRGVLRLLADGVPVASRRVHARTGALLSIRIHAARLRGCTALAAVLE
jgi:NADPH-dependent 2,4-dienoyl-CoA reductase/sulfur reductase-like enzyme